MFFGGSLGVCPAGGAHDINGSGDYTLQEAPTPGQQNWRWCHLCSGLFFAGNPTTGWCPAPAAGGHNYAGSGDYSLQEAPGTGQDNWRWCHRCQGLFFAGQATSGDCPAGGGHDYTGSADYIVIVG